MPKMGEKQYSILVVSGSEKFDAQVRKVLSRGRFLPPGFHRNAASARRCLLEHEYDLVVVNCPLPDEFGHELAADAARKWGASVLMVVPAEVYDNVLEHVTDMGILALAKPASQERLGHAVRYLAAVRGRIHELQQQVRRAAEKMDELRLVSKAKILLVEKRHLTEDEAHSLIGREAMDHGLTRKRVAQQMIEDLE
ncbi:MAG: ANTAR domain-containing protein [Lachnospiraceae bacterium]|nr:ANTAR domain-containing protein [Lachnospiraceae bacterium]